MQQQMEIAAAAAGVQLSTPGPRMSDRVRQALGISAADEAVMARDIAAARADLASAGAGSGTGGSSAAGTPFSRRSDGSGDSNSPGISDDCADPSLFGTPGGPSSPPDDAKRVWGSWAGSKRITRSAAASLSASSTGSKGPASTRSSELPDVRTRTGGGGPPSAGGPAAAEDGVTIVSKRTGSRRPPRQPSDPQARQDSVREALRSIADEWQAPSTSAAGSAAQGDTDTVPAQLIGGSSGGAPGPWWRQRFQALYLPTLCYSSGSVGFVQFDVSMRAGATDVRVLAFEDRHDCAHCLAVMREWPDVAGCVLTVGGMPTSSVEADIREAWLEQRRQAEARRWGEPQGATAAGPEPPPPSPPAGLVVCRRGKLQLRVGMGREEFVQGVVYLAAAQAALDRIGYSFSD